MARTILPLMMLIFLYKFAVAQRDPPLLECYLPSIMVSHAEDEKLALDLVLKKETGPVEHREHQMILLAYLLDDEPAVLESIANPELTDKTKGGDAKLFLDVLIDKGLIVVLDAKVAPRQGFAGQDNSGKYADGSKAARSREAFLKLNSFAFSFSPTYQQLLSKVSELKNFRSEDRSKSEAGIRAERFKILVYVPVNDCKYATQVRDGVRGKNDFGLDEYGSGKTAILYCRPLPYEFEFRQDRQVGTIVYIR